MQVLHPRGAVHCPPEDILQRAEAAQARISSAATFAEVLQSREAFAEIEALYTRAKNLEMRVKLIRNNTHAALSHRAQLYREQLSAVADAKAPPPAHRLPEIAPGVRLPAIPVASEEFVPDTPLYYVRSTGEYGVRVGGALISGAVGEISASGRKHIPCPRTGCSAGQCPWHHPGEPLGWTPSNWMYSHRPVNRKNQYMRHYGSRSTLATDIGTSSARERYLRGKQLAHDLLAHLAAAAKFENIDR